MARYDPLSRYLRRQSAAELELSFAEIETLIAALLPKSAARPQWWANEKSADSTHVQKRAWADAGYDAFLIAGRDRVKFRRRG